MKNYHKELSGNHPRCVHKRPKSPVSTDGPGHLPGGMMPSLSRFVGPCRRWGALSTQVGAGEETGQSWHRCSNASRGRRPTTASNLDTLRPLVGRSAHAVEFSKTVASSRGVSLWRMLPEPVKRSGQKSIATFRLGAQTHGACACFRSAWPRSLPDAK